MFRLGTELQISAIFVVFFVSIAGCLFPMLLARRYSLEQILTGGAFIVLKCIATGVVLGVSTMHLLPEAVEALADHTEYPLGFLIAIGGALFTLAIDQIASYAMMNAGEELKHSASAEKRGGGNGIMETILAPHDREHEHGHEDDISRENLLNHSTDSDGAGRDATADTSMEKAFDRVTAPIRRKSRTTSLDEDIQLYGHNHRHIHVPSDYDEKIIQKIKMKAYILEAAIATHSIIIGFEYGTLSPTDDLVQIKILYVAFVFHQMFEGIGLGTVLSAAEKALGMTVVISLVLIFSTTFSIGILLGMHAAQSSEASEIVTACANALAAGILLHSSMIEMISEDFSNPVFERKPLVKFFMYIGLLFGFGVMAVLAVWA